jgi:hypothetical protein
MFKKGHDGKFAPGRPLGTRKGVAQHDASTEAIKDRLHNDLNPSRKVVAPHDNQLAPGVDSGRKPTVHDCATDCGPNSAANSAFNNAAQNPPTETTNAGRLVGAGIKMN